MMLAIYTAQSGFQCIYIYIYLCLLLVVIHVAISVYANLPGVRAGKGP